MTPTDEQTEILDVVRTTGDNIMIGASAGTGKTSTLQLIEHATKTKPILYIVFNRRNADEAKDKMLSTTVVKTANGCGHGIWQDTVGTKLSLNPKKVNELFKVLVNEAPKNLRSEMWECYWQVIHGVALAKNLGYVPEGKFQNAKRLITRDAFLASPCHEEAPDDLTADLIDAVLTSSIKAAYAGAVDYNDQIYMPALFGGTYPRFPLVFVDEYQDLNPVNHELIARLAKGRLIGVGDECQNIYAFRGAKQGGMRAAVAAFGMKECNLSISFRCPQRVVEAARWRVPHFKWVKPGGHVESLRTIDISAMPNESAIICRNNAPLFQLAIHMLSNGRSVTVAGSDIGPKLLGILRRLGPEDLPRSTVLRAIADWEADKLAKDSTTAPDMAACMRVFAELGADLGQAVRYAEDVLAKKGSIQLLTGHKSKGLEFDNVYLLDPWLMREDEQDLNLRYVCQTRSAGSLYEVNSKDIQ